MLDRRRNWVFMTMEDLLPEKDPAKALGLKQYEKDGREEQPTTAIERFYHRLYDADYAKATNQIDEADSNPWSKSINALSGEGGKGNNLRPFDGAFGKPAEPGVSQAGRSSGFSDIFRSDSDMPSSEMVRAQKEQREHIESFKQMWDLGQPPPASDSSAFALGDSPSSVPVRRSQPVSSGAVSPSVGSFSAPASPAAVRPVIQSHPAIMPTLVTPRRRF
jgi:hypothetical protein